VDIGRPHFENRAALPGPGALIAITDEPATVVSSRVAADTLFTEIGRKSATLTRVPSNRE
jgi:hypothetical protein